MSTLHQLRAEYLAKARRSYQAAKEQTSGSIAQASCREHVQICIQLARMLHKRILRGEE